MSAPRTRRSSHSSDSARKEEGARPPVSVSVLRTARRRRLRPLSAERARQQARGLRRATFRRKRMTSRPSLVHLRAAHLTRYPSPIQHRRRSVTRHRIFTHHSITLHLKVESIVAFMFYKSFGIAAARIIRPQREHDQPPTPTTSTTSSPTTSARRVDPVLWAPDRRRAPPSSRRYPIRVSTTRSKQHLTADPPQVVRCPAGYSSSS